MLDDGIGNIVLMFDGMNVLFDDGVVICKLAFEDSLLFKWMLVEKSVIGLNKIVELLLERFVE